MSTARLHGPARPQPFSDTVTMLRRNILHHLRAPSGTLMIIAVPLIMLLLFVYVLGGTLGAGIAAGGTRDQYLGYITPAILLTTAASAMQMIAVWVSMDMTTGIIARFRTMAISRGSVLAGHVAGGTILIALAIAVLLALTLLLGYRPQADLLHWLGFAALVLLVGFALSSLAVAFGLFARRPDTASNLPLVLMLLPLLSGGFVPTESLPGWLQGFAEHQPFTPIINTIRGLLSGTPDPAAAAWAIGWCAAIAIAGSVWSLRLYRRHAAPAATGATGA
ncbi:ABC transporter permease [Agromyces sp. SYSU K20354]|uniref:ABC transporter permease n=1 Tax=Agromyces cavernae TaxID=2898659 RepID=UPI001E543A9E|nr:ABC transporter permease [Agromyces cavernae]MCD2444298.1 ABC transporter permease [Agromyces cavernae]